MGVGFNAKPLHHIGDGRYLNFAHLQFLLNERIRFDSTGWQLFLLRVCKLIQLDIAEVENHIDGNLNKVQEIEEPGQEEDETGAAVCKLDKVLGNTKNITDPDENFKLKGFALGGAGLPGLINRQGPAKAEANNHNGFTNFSNHFRSHNTNLPFLIIFLKLTAHGGHTWAAAEEKHPPELRQPSSVLPRRR